MEGQFGDETIEGTIADEASVLEGTLSWQIGNDETISLGVEGKAQVLAADRQLSDGSAVDIEGPGRNVEVGAGVGGGLGAGGSAGCETGEGLCVSINGKAVLLLKVKANVRVCIGN